MLKGLNDKYVSELRTDPNKEAEFMTSQFSNIASIIRKENYKLKDILGIVQMAIVKMFIEADENGNLINDM